MREKFNCPKRKKTRNNIFFVLAAFFHISTRQAEQKSCVLFVCLNQLARNARVSGKKNYVGEEKKYIGHILKYKAHISKYVRHIFECPKNACIETFARWHSLAHGFNIPLPAACRNVNYMCEAFHA